MADAEELISEYLRTISNEGTAFTTGHYLRMFDRQVGLTRAAESDDGWEIINGWLSENGRGPSTQNTYLSTLKGFYEWAEGRGAVERVPTHRVPRREESQGRITGILDNDLKRALKDADDDVRAFLLLARYAGSGPQEMTLLEPDDLTFEGDQAWLYLHGGKTSPRRVPVPSDVVQAIAAIEPTHDDRIWDLHPYKLSKIVNVYLTSVGVTARLRDLRHQYGFDTWAEFQNIEVVQERMGFKSPNPAVIYKEDWKLSLVAASEEESTFRLSLWEDFKSQGSVVEIETINGLINPGDAPDFPLILSVASPIDDVTDNEVVIPASESELSGLSHALFGHVPVLIAAPTVEAESVEVRLGWVARVAAEIGLALVALSEQPPEAPDSEVEEETSLASSRAERFESRKARPHQARFKFRVLERYGSQCAVCAVTHPSVLEAAHIRPWIERGSDHPGNGLVLCPLHHRAYDAGLWAIEPGNLDLLPSHGGPSLSELLISRRSLDHLTIKPMDEALEYAWLRRWTVGRREGVVITEPNDTSSQSRSRNQP